MTQNRIFAFDVENKCKIIKIYLLNVCSHKMSNRFELTPNYMVDNVIVF